jgi:hypothetical protein
MFVRASTHECSQGIRSGVNAGSMTRIPTLDVDVGLLLAIHDTLPELFASSRPTKTTRVSCVAMGHRSINICSTDHCVK